MKLHGITTFCVENRSAGLSLGIVSAGPLVLGPLYARAAIELSSSAVVEAAVIAVLCLCGALALAGFGVYWVGTGSESHRDKA